jgi:hypothetical protein
VSWLSGYLAMAPIGRRRRLTRAAGVASAVLACHAETWSEIQALAGGLHSPRVIKGTVRGNGGEDGLTEITMSGVALAALLQSMHEAATAPDASGMPFSRRFAPYHRAVARRVYLAVAEAVREAGPGQSEAMPPIVIDDRAPGAGAKP